MQRPQRILVVLACILGAGAGKQRPASNTDPPSGAWLQTHLKWKNPSSVNPRLQASQATILYFGEDHTFAMLMCVVVRVPGESTSIKGDEGLALWRGQWTTDRKGIAVWYEPVPYEFVPPLPRQWPEAPIVGLGVEHATIHRSHEQLTFADMKFQRDSALDDDAHYAMLATTKAIKLLPDE